MLSRLVAKMRWFGLKWAGAQIRRGVNIDGSRLLRGDARGLICEGNAYFSDGVRLLIGQRDGKTGRLQIGTGCYFNHFVVIDCHLSVEIGSRVMVGPHTYIGDFDHDFSTEQDLQIAHGGKAAPVKIGDDVWIGAGCVVLKGVSIGRGAVIGAGSVVTRDVPEAMIAAGVPARVIRRRGASDAPQTQQCSLR
jgi:acetyltransferase-like isoleucine patch superfamily enzyme